MSTVQRVLCSSSSSPDPASVAASIIGRKYGGVPPLGCPGGARLGGDAAAVRPAVLIPHLQHDVTGGICDVCAFTAAVMCPTS